MKLRSIAIGLLATALSCNLGKEKEAHRAEIVPAVETTGYTRLQIFCRSLIDETPLKENEINGIGGEISGAKSEIYRVARREISIPTPTGSLIADCEYEIPVDPTNPHSTARAHPHSFSIQRNTVDGTSVRYIDYDADGVVDQLDLETDIPTDPATVQKFYQVIIDMIMDQLKPKSNPSPNRSIDIPEDSLPA